MDSKILALTITGVVAIVIIATVVVYQFAEQQYAQFIIGENIRNLEVQKGKAEQNSERLQMIREMNSREFPEYERCYNDWVTNKIHKDESPYLKMRRM